jgi:phosphoglycerate dehydrogenase-like enzyme
VAIVDQRGSAFAAPVVQTLEGAGCEVVSSRADAEDEIISIVREADGIIYNGVVSRAFVEALTRCKVLVRPSVGMDIVHGVELATEKGIVVCNTPGVIEEEVADHTFALLLAVSRCLRPLEEHVRSGAWRRGEALQQLRPLRLAGRRLGVVGFGRIGRAVAQRALGFGMQVIAHDPFVVGEVIVRHGARAVTLAEVLQDSDVVSLHVPWSPATDKLIAERELLMMRPDAILLNTSRGSIVDEEALVEVLRSGRIGGAGLDVMDHEPLPADHPLCGLANVVLTPHFGSRSVWADTERYVRAAQQVIAVLAGLRPYAVWNPEVLERVELR